MDASNNHIHFTPALSKCHCNAYLLRWDSNGTQMMSTLKTVQEIGEKWVLLHCHNDLDSWGMFYISQFDM